MKHYRVDLHTHSKLSPDGSIEENDYQKVLVSGSLDAIAITDHNTTDYAFYCQKKLGNQIIVGEEISTIQGHLIGLFLKKPIPAGKDVLESAEEIKSQGGLVYVPHPFDIFRSGIGQTHLNRILEYVDLLEVCNGRMIFEYFNHQAEQFAERNDLMSGFGSDAHVAYALGQGAIILPQLPTKHLASFKNGIIDNTHTSFLRFFAPKYNKIKKLLIS